MPAQGLTGSVRTVDGREIAGTVTIDDKGSVSVKPETGAAETLAFADLMAIQPATLPPAPQGAVHQVLLRSGGELPAKALTGMVVAGQPPQLQITLPTGTDCTLPLHALAGLRILHDGVAAPATFAQDLAEPNPTQDFLYVVKDGKAQRFSVTVDGFTADQVKFTLRGQSYDFGIDGVQGIVFAKNTGFAPDRQPRPRAAVSLASGHTIEGRMLGLDTGCRVRLDEGCVVDVPCKDIARIAVVTDKLTWLSELKPTVEQVPAFDRVWPWTADRSPAGPGLKLAGQTYARGLEMVPRTRLTYDLGGKYDLFEALIGIDERGGPQAHAIFRVLVDGKVAFESEPMTLGKTPVAVRLDLAKCKSLALEVDFGKNFDLGDLCAFADARVVQH
jgi:hypothetical protein